MVILGKIPNEVLPLELHIAHISNVLVQSRFSKHSWQDLKSAVSACLKLCFFETAA